MSSEAVVVCRPSPLLRDTSPVRSSSPGCTAFNSVDLPTPEAPATTVVTPRNESDSMTVVRVYNLKAIGLQHATTEEIEAFTTIICDMVVTKDWKKTRSDVQVFGSMMTVKATVMAVKSKPIPKNLSAAI